ncbi:MAG: hypothetical protein JWQ96_2570 [Segetibacter sp.]|nr:hypothetical protein [Segetibacter sp.]
MHKEQIVQVSDTTMLNSVSMPVTNYTPTNFSILPKNSLGTNYERVSPK